MYTNNNLSTLGMSNFVGHQHVLRPISLSDTFNPWSLESFETNKAKREAGFITNFSISEQGRYKRLIKAYTKITGRRELHIVHDAYDIHGGKLPSDHALYWCSDAKIKNTDLVGAIHRDLILSDDIFRPCWWADTEEGFLMTKLDEGMLPFYERVVRLYNGFCGKEVLYIVNSDEILGGFKLFWRGNRDDVDQETINNFWVFASRACCAIFSRVAITSEIMEKYPAGLKALEKAI